MIRNVLLISLFIGIPSISFSQQDSLKRARLYRSWISSVKNQTSYTGILYNIRDTLVLISESRSRQDYTNGNFRVTEIPYYNIDFIKTRNINSVKIGIWSGAVAAFSISAAFILQSRDDVSEYYPLVFLLVTAPATGMGALIGGLAGSTRITIPINRNLNDFKNNRRTLEKYSYVNEYPPAQKGQEIVHKSYIAILDGPSFPVGEFKDNFEGNETTSTGYFSKIPGINVRINERFGVSGLGFYSQFNIVRNDSALWWGIAGMMAGPMFSAPVGNKFYFDIKPMVGEADSQLQSGEHMLKDGKGLALSLSASFLYNFSKRWCAIAESGFFQTRQKYLNGSKSSIHTINLNLGIGFRFR